VNLQVTLKRVAKVRQHNAAKTTMKLLQGHPIAVHYHFHLHAQMLLTSLNGQVLIHSRRDIKSSQQLESLVWAEVV